MKDYSAMSDFEINAIVAGRIAILSHGLFCEEITARDGTVRVKSLDGRYRTFNPCNAWADAGPIIVENKINISFRKSSKCGPMASLGGNDSVFAVHQNPLRAAMIVFLMKTEI